jgi:hypothetical protein
VDKKRVVLGTFAESRKIGRYHSPLHVTVEIEIEKHDSKERLSICGETYYRDARDCESGGQILDEVRRLLQESGDERLNKPREQIERLLLVWERWHLNDMRAGCEHQRAQWDPSRKIELVTYKQTKAAMLKDHATAREAVKRLVNGETVTYSPEEIRLAKLPYQITRGATQPAPGPDYEEEKRETKTAGWVKPDEDPAGLLAKPCEVCGYKYGTAWLYEALPPNVVKFLEDF